MKIKKKNNELHPVERDMACVSFAEAGEPCPLHGADKGDKKVNEDPHAVTGVEKHMACVAYHEVGEDCPLDQAE